MSVQKAVVDLSGLDAERQALQQKLRDLDARAERLRVYIEVSQEYGDQPTKLRDASPKETAQDNHPSERKQKTDGARGITELAVETSIELLAAKGSPIHTRDLLKQLADRNIHIKGGKPVANLSGFLSREKARLRNSRTSGWSLREWGDDSASTSTSQPTVDHEHGMNTDTAEPNGSPPQDGE